MTQTIPRNTRKNNTNHTFNYGGQHFTYDILPNAVDSHQESAWWFAVVVRFANIRTFDRSFIQPRSSAFTVSLPAALADPIAERSALVLSSQITNFTVTHSKASPVASASFGLAASATDIRRVVQGGDWILFWAFDNFQDFQRVYCTARDIVGGGSASLDAFHTGANGFRDGLKFVGRCNSPRRPTSVDGNGNKSTTGQLTATGFGEFNSSIYYNEAHKSKYNALRAGYLQQIVDKAAVPESVILDGLPLKTREHILIWLNTFLGTGPGAASKGFDPSILNAADGFAPDAINGGLVASPNDTFLVPRTVGRLLGINQPGRVRYTDILNTFVGVQGGSSGHADRTTQGPDAYKGFLPVSVGEPSGVFHSQWSNFDNTTVWAMLSAYANQPLNEMFTSLRVGADGRVKPSFMCRQNVLSSRKAANNLSTLGTAVTAFVDLPRWRLAKALVSSENLAASDSYRFNYCYIQTTFLPGGQKVNMDVQQSVLSPAMCDSADVQRNGVHPYIQTTNSDVSGVLNVGEQLGRSYTAFMADIVMEQHLRWNGSIDAVYIQEPIAPGDNLEYGQEIYQIEQVVHNGFIDGEGRKTIQTSLGVSNGLSTLSDDAFDNVYPYEDSPSYPGITEETRTHVDGELAATQSALDDVQRARRGIIPIDLDIPGL